MLSSICVKQDFTARWLPDILWMAIFYKKAFQFSHVAFKCKSLILAGPIAYFRWPVFKFWLKACLCMNQQILHVWYQSPNFTLELQVHVLFRLFSFQFLTFEIKLLTARLHLKWTATYETDLTSTVYCVTKTVYPWLKGTKWPRM